MLGPPLARAQEPAASDGARRRYQTVVEAPAEERESPREDEAASASVVTSDRTPRSGETLPQILSELPGVSVTRLGGLGSMATLSLRGSAANQVAIYVDGIPLNSATWGSVDLGALPIADLERIEVYRGMSPMSFGASALGGVVSLSSRVPRATGATAYAGGGSFTTGFAGAEATWATRRVRLLASANGLGAKGDFPYRSENGTLARPDDDVVLRRENNRLTQADGLLRAAVPGPGRREFLATLSYLQRRQGLPPYAIFRPLGAPSLETKRFLGSVLYSSRDDLGAGGRLRVTTYGGVTEQQFSDAEGQLSLKGTITHDRSVSVGSTATGSRPLATWLRLAATVDVRHETFTPFDELERAPSGPPGQRTFGAVGAEAHALVARAALELLPSFRVEAAHDEVLTRLFSQRYVDQTHPVTYVLPIARLALLQRPARWLTLRGNIGRYARVPTMFERYGNTGAVSPNPSLRPEAGLNADVGVMAAWGQPEGTGLTLDAALFGARVRDLIDYQGLSIQQAVNVGQARIGGGELSAAARIGRHGRLVAQGTFTDARDLTLLSGHRHPQLPHRPRLRAYARPELRALPLGFGWRFGLYGEVDATGGNYLDPTNQARLPSRVLAGAGASVESPAARWRLVASAQNLGNAHVVDFVGNPLPGRSLWITLQWSSSAHAHAQPKETVP